MIVFGIEKIIFKVVTSMTTMPVEKTMQVNVSIKSCKKTHVENPFVYTVNA